MEIKDTEPLQKYLPKNHTGIQAEAHSTNQGNQPDMDMCCRIITWLPHGVFGFCLPGNNHSKIKTFLVTLQVGIDFHEVHWFFRDDGNGNLISMRLQWAVFSPGVRQQFSKVFKYVTNFKHLNSSKSIFYRTLPNTKLWRPNVLKICHPNPLSFILY